MPTYLRNPLRNIGDRGCQYHLKFEHHPPFKNLVCYRTYSFWPLHRTFRRSSISFL